VTANAPTGRHFVNWTGTGGFSSTSNPVTVPNVTQAMTITAHFAANQYAVTFVTDGTTGASLSGTTSQTVNHGASCSAVTANAPTGWHFVNWTGTGGFVTTTANPLAVTNVTSTMSITAHFGVTTLVYPPNGTMPFSRVGTLRWGAVSGATSFDVQVATDSAFSAVVASASVSVAEWQITPALPAATTLYWRVRAVVSGVPEAWSAPWSFTTYQALPCGNCT
jgi:uncharacterized repeat protein (TIGR02543 family)